MPYACFDCQLGSLGTGGPSPQVCCTSERVEPALRRDDSGGFSSRRVRESRKIEKKRLSVIWFLVAIVTVPPCWGEYHYVGHGKAFAVRGRRRGNPNWGRPAQPAPVLATEFEKQVQQLGLTKQTCAASTQLRNWCKRNRNRCYIPEGLLGAWGIQVEPTVSGEVLPRRK